MNARDLGEQTLWCPESASEVADQSQKNSDQTKVIQISSKKGYKKKNLKEKTLPIYVQHLTSPQDQNVLGA